MVDDAQHRDYPGTHIRAATRADAIDLIARARLNPVERAHVLEALESAACADRHGDDLGGARLLMQRSADTRPLPPVSDLLAQLASRFVHPPRRP